MKKLSKFSDWLVIVCSVLLGMLCFSILSIGMCCLIYEVETSKIAFYLFSFCGAVFGGKLGDLLGTWLVNRDYSETVKWYSKWIDKEDN